MKKIILMIVLAVSLLVGCSKEDDLIIPKSITPIEIKYDHKLHYECSAEGWMYPEVIIEVYHNDSLIKSINNYRGFKHGVSGDVGINKGDSLSFLCRCWFGSESGYLHPLVNSVGLFIKVDTVNVIKDVYIKNDWRYNKLF